MALAVLAHRCTVSRPHYGWNPCPGRIALLYKEDGKMKPRGNREQECPRSGGSRLSRDCRSYGLDSRKNKLPVELVKLR